MDTVTITANKPHLKIMGIMFNISLHKYLQKKSYKTCLMKKRKLLKKHATQLCTDLVNLKVAALALLTYMIQLGGIYEHDHEFLFLNRPYPR
jgi:hypothetical protein